jgi:cob(I)alamin adenosyltransferase
MKIYTGTGDAGETGLFGGVRVRKDDVRVEAYGTIDEANAALGVARASSLPPRIDRLAAELQADLFVLGSELAAVPGSESKLGIQLLSDADSERLEHTIDSIEEQLPALKNFVLPTGSPGAAALHHARTVVRRAERRMVRLAAQEPVRSAVLVYLNRLADLLFCLARLANQEAGVPDEPWAPRGVRA